MSLLPQIWINYITFIFTKFWSEQRKNKALPFKVIDRECGKPRNRTLGAQYSAFIYTLNNEIRNIKTYVKANGSGKQSKWGVREGNQMRAENRKS